MAINGISSWAGSTSSRVTGLASNMDTDTLVKQVMQAQTMKYTKILQKRQLSEWKVESYRDVTSTLQSFYKEYFDTVSTKNLKSTNSFASFAAAYGTSTSTDYVSVTPGASAKAGTYSISALTAAKAASITSGASVTKVVEGAAATASIDISSANDNNTFVFTLNNVTKQFTLDDSGATTIGAYASKIQDKLDIAFGKDRVLVGTNGDGKLEFTAKSTDTFSIGTAYNSGSSTLFSVAPSIDTPFVLKAGNNKFDLTIGGVTKSITVPLGAGGVPKVYTDPAILAADIRAEAKLAFPAASATIDAAFTVKDGKVAFDSSVSVSAAKTGTNATLGLSPSNLSNKVNLTAKVSDIAGGFAFDPAVSGTGNDIEFTINGKYFRFNSKEVSINDIMKKVNADTTINASMKYNITTNSFEVVSKGTGATDKLEVIDKTGAFMAALGIVDKVTKTKTAIGSDASVTIQNGSDPAITIVRPSNVFTYDGLTFDIKKDFKAGTDIDTGVVTDPIKVTVTSDTTKTYDFIKGFVDKYNEVIDKLNTKINEKVYKDYAPLTDEERAAMTEDQVKAWETKAKSGLLKNDSIISDTLYKLRSALYASVEGTGMTLQSIGITTSSDYTQKGKLVINETKLKEALASQPEEVAKLFTNSSDISYYDSINSTSLKSQRYKESGIAQKFSDLIQDVIRTNTDSSGNKGTLLEKAGILGDRSEYDNILFEQIKDYDDAAYELSRKLTERETALYKKYAAMESALSKLNDQSSWIAQQFGGS